MHSTCNNLVITTHPHITNDLQLYMMLYYCILYYTSYMYMMMCIPVYVQKMMCSHSHTTYYYYATTSYVIQLLYMYNYNMYVCCMYRCIGVSADSVRPMLDKKWAIFSTKRT